MAGELVLLTGATGMIGFKTLVLLVEAGYQVRAAVRNQAGFDKIVALRPVAKYRSQITSIVVPEITAPGAYDEAVKGVKYIVHVASPLSGRGNGGDYETTLFQPAIQGTVGILSSAVQTTGIEKIVITSSITAIANLTDTTETLTESSSYASTEGPFSSDFAAYAASKARALTATKEFIAKHKPAFNIISILPTFVLGRDETAGEASSITKGTNGLLMNPILGNARPTPLYGSSVHVDDVAKSHVLALNPKISGNEDFLVAGPNLGVVNWGDSFDIVKRLYPKAYAEGVFKFDSIDKPVSVDFRIDNSKARKILGLEFKSYEEQIVSVVDHYLELLGKN